MATLREIPPPSSLSARPPAPGGSDLTGRTAARSKARKKSPFKEPVHETLPNPWLHVQKLAFRQLDRLVSLEPKVLRDESPAAIHDIRVASRRLQEILDLLYPTHRPHEIQKLRRKLRRARRALSDVRNCDVLLERVDRALARKRTAHREAWEILQTFIKKRRAEAASTGLRKLSRANLASLYLQLKKHVASGSLPSAPRPAVPSPAVDPSPSKAVIALPEKEESFRQRLARALEREWQAFDARVAASHSSEDAPLIHEVRIAAKRLRYLIEVIQQFEVPGSGDALAWLRKLQQHLGNWHDLEVLEEMMLDMVGRPQFLRDSLDIAMKVERLILRDRVSRKQLVQRYRHMTLGSGEYQGLAEWVGDALATPAASGLLQEAESQSD